MNSISRTLRKKAEKALSRPDLNVQGEKEIRSALKKNDSATLQNLLRNWIRKGIQLDKSIFSFSTIRSRIAAVSKQSVTPTTVPQAVHCTKNIFFIVPLMFSFSTNSKSELGHCGHFDGAIYFSFRCKECLFVTIIIAPLSAWYIDWLAPPRVDCLVGVDILVSRARSRVIESGISSRDSTRTAVHKSRTISPAGHPVGHYDKFIG